MREIRTGADPHEWLAAQIGPVPLEAVVFGSYRDRSCIGAIAFFNHLPHLGDCEMAVAGSPRAWTPIFMRRCADYAWKELKLDRVSVNTASVDVARLAIRMGAKLEGVKRSPKGPIYGLGILASEWFRHEIPKPPDAA